MVLQPLRAARPHPKTPQPTVRPLRHLHPRPHHQEQKGQSINRKLEIYAAQMRAKPSPPEEIIWPLLQRNGFKWQHVLEPFIVDFYHESLHLGIEVDGKFHGKQTEKDTERSRLLATRYKVRIYRLRAQDCFNGSYWGKINNVIDLVRRGGGFLMEVR